MVLPKNSATTRTSGATSAKSLLKKKAPLQQSRLTFAGASSSEAPAGPSSTAVLRQASIFDLAGVVQYSEETTDVPTTLYLGEDDILRLRGTLETATEREDILRVLRRLSAMPCTRQVLESTRIGVAVGHLRSRHADEEVRSLAERIVSVWKRQLKEHAAQKQAVPSRKQQQPASSARRR